MTRNRCAAFVIALLAAPAVAPAQPNGTQVQITKELAVTLPAGWRLSHQGRDSLSVSVPLKKERQLPPATGKNPKPPFVVAAEAGMLITTEQRRDHAEAVRRLAEIASERPEPATPLIIGGWPAIERRYRAPMPQPGRQEPSGPGGLTDFVTTAVAEGAILVRFETMLAPDADPKLVEEAMALGRALRAPQGQAEEANKSDLEQVQRLTRPPGHLPPQAAAMRPETRPETQPQPGGGKSPGVAVQVQTGVGELEVATNDGQHVVVAVNSGYSYSDDFSATYTFGGGTPCNQAVCDGDPSLAAGVSGDIYYAWIGGTSVSAFSDGVSRSIDNGHTFTFRGLSATCPGSTGCTVADQEHIAADRNNAAVGGGDRVYSVWRDFGTVFSIRISCSIDGGTTWTGGEAIAAGDLPRVSVGGDGAVYVAYPSGGNAMLHKFSNCDSGLTPNVGWPITVSTFTNVGCPVPGLDRCNGRNILSSPKVAVDDLDPSHIYYAFATATSPANEDVMVFDSTNGGVSFPRSVRVNDPVTGRRYMPWIATYGGIATVSWYDRRTASAASNDLTRFHVGGAAVRGPNLVQLADTDLSNVDDTECSGWPSCDATNAVTDSESCSTQPQLAGWCSVSHTPCDFLTPACPAGQTCVTDRGCPKFGDYNGHAAGAGRAYSAWASATPPAGLSGTAGTIRVYASADRIPSDLYVRDWNDSPTSFDNGAQPSTHANFWSTSDVWNQSASAVDSPGAGGFVVGDPPNRAGSNFTFAQVSRRAPAMSTAPDAVVTVHFLFGDFGMSADFVPIGDETVTFAAADITKITPAHSWTVPTTASSHLCLAVQIDGPDGDTFALPSLIGNAPGPADPLILADNNKAQRNLQDTIGTGAGTELIAIIRNAERERRDIRLRIAVPGGVKIPGLFEVVGGAPGAEVGDAARIDVGTLAPGESRWLRFHADSLAGLDHPVLIDVFEDTTPPGNGFTILLHRDTIEKVAARNLTLFSVVLSRLAKMERKCLIAEHEAKLALRAAAKPTPASYARYLRHSMAAVKVLVALHLKSTEGQDPFGIGAARKELAAALAAKGLGARGGGPAPP